MDLEALCQDVVRATEEIAGEIWHRSGAVAASEVRHKAAGDVATEIDLWAERALRERLLPLWPGSQFMGEETGGSLGLAPTWIVDPIDGTANFVRGYPQWSVSVALALEAGPVLGVIADPNRRECFYATKGRGAWCKSPRGVHAMRCSTVSEPLKATVATVFPKPHSPLMDAYVPEFEAVIRRFGQVRRSGSMALELAYVAAGRADAFWERGMQAWDAAAGMVLLAEAGAQTIALDRLPTLQSQFLACGSPAMLPELLVCLQSVAPQK